jgi:phosphoribosyl 1,2-cyclic phosphodiesterase
MSLFVASLNSGSNGNCYYIGNQEDAVLIDGGISCREIEKRMKRLGLSLRKVKAVFISHEHGDHIHGIPTLCKKHKVPVYTTEQMFRQGDLRVQEKFVRYFNPHEPVSIGNLLIHPFPKKHDAVDPYSFRVVHERVSVGVFTDIGAPCENVIQHFRECHAAFLESNYDEDMLANGSYPLALKNRIRGGNGHLSNRQAEALFIQHRSSFMSHLFLSHLSRNNNSPKIVKEMFTKIANGVEVVIASRQKETALYHIRNNFYRRPQPRISEATQLSLFY